MSLTVQTLLRRLSDAGAIEARLQRGSPCTGHDDVDIAVSPVSQTLPLARRPLLSPSRALWTRSPRSSTCVSSAPAARLSFADTVPYPARPSTAVQLCPSALSIRMSSHLRLRLARSPWPPASLVYAFFPPSHVLQNTFFPCQTCRSHSYGPCSALCVRSKPPLAPTKLGTRCIVRRFSPAYPQWRVRILLHSIAIAIVSLQVDLQTTRTRTALTGSN